MKKDDKKKTCPISRYIFDWIKTYLPRQRHSSEATITTYNRAVCLYLEYLESIGEKETTEKCFSPDIINGWIQWMTETRNNAPTTCNNRIAVIKSLLKYLGSRDRILKSLYYEASEYVRQVKAPKRKVHGIPKAGIKAILATPDENERNGLRDKTFLQLLYVGALRLDEILSLTLDNVHINEKVPFIIVTGKGDKPRVINIYQRDVIQIRKYLAVYHTKRSEPSDYLFYSPVHDEKRKLSQEAMRKRVRIICDKAREKCKYVPEKVQPHQFRHARAQHLLDDKLVNLAELSEFLGHADIKTTMVYLDITIEAKEEALSNMEKEENLPREKKWKDKTSEIAALRAKLGF